MNHAGFSRVIRMGFLFSCTQPHSTPHTQHTTHTLEQHITTPTRRPEHVQEIEYTKQNTNTDTQPTSHTLYRIHAQSERKTQRRTDTDSQTSFSFFFFHRVLCAETWCETTTGTASRVGSFSWPTGFWNRPGAPRGSCPRKRDQHGDVEGNLNLSVQKLQ